MGQSPEGGDFAPLTSDSIAQALFGGDSDRRKQALEQMDRDLDDHDDDYDDDDVYGGLDALDWTGERGDFTKKYNAARTGVVTGQQQAAAGHQQHSRHTGSSTGNTGNTSNDIGESKGKQAERVVTQKVNQGKFERPRVNAGQQHVISSKVTGTLKQHERAVEAIRVRTKDKSDRATSEQVLDPRTRLILFKMLSKGVVNVVNGCLSTGKEANVYHATNEAGSEFAIKIYKTSILVFKDRDRYVSGDYRFRKGYSKHNPRKMVRTWAEKEMRNLARLEAAGIPCPHPILLRQHVLLMDFIGKEGWPAPKLKDAKLSDSKMRAAYGDCIRLMRRMYHDCRLVHADLSEYNMLYYKNTLYFIDVSQSVEHDHPHAIEFLRMDCKNVTDYFARNKVRTMSYRELFDFITDPSITADNIDAYLEKMMEIVGNRSSNVTAEEEVSANVFQQVFIPKTLDDVVHFERDLAKAGSEGKELHYAKIVGLKSDLTGTQDAPELLEDGEKKKKKKKKKKEAEEEERDAQEAALCALDDEAVFDIDQGAPDAVEVGEEDKEEGADPDSGSSASDSYDGSHSSGEYSDDDEEGEDGEKKKKKYKGKKKKKEPSNQLEALSRKERKKLVKEMNRERRANKQTRKKDKKRKKVLAQRYK
eukprot:TRINITY_DN2737_c1_g2_i2.p1 TRINITY_DN2737_c1_g2~~TRINITY_DN2737_c1_g2_i2.p1  ORF type:complete len:645 (-),score=209.11 TRINITY_DN2737_c1_g2_i2:82-2016(-)